MGILALQNAGERFGRVLAIRRAGGFVFRLSCYHGGAETPPHRHPDTYFSFAVDGAMDERVGSRTATHTPGTVHLHPAEEPHAVRVGASGLVNLSIIPSGEMAARIGQRLQRVPAAAAGAGLHAAAASCWACFRVAAGDSDLSLELAALELAAALLRWSGGVRPGARPRWLDAVRGQLDQQYGEGLTLGRLAETAGVHEIYLARAFRRHLGLSPGAYLRRVRIAAARLALIDGAEPLAEIALACGFSSQSHFTRVFVRHIGLPPAAFRRRHGRARSGPAPRGRPERQVRIVQDRGRFTR